MTLMPVSNISDSGCRSSNLGAGRWMSQWALMPSVTSSPWVSRGSPITFHTWPSTPGPTGTEVGLGALGLAQRLGAAHDLHDLGGDARLGQLVGVDGQVLDELLGVVGGGLHGPLAGGLLRRRRLEQGGEDARLDVTREESGED